MEACLLDTNVIIDAINRKNGRPDSLQRLIDEGILLACCSINITEVYMGMRPHEQEQTGKLLRSLEFIRLLGRSRNMRANSTASRGNKARP
jgi:predicted nucleic acid-binding protein